MKGKVSIWSRLGRAMISMVLCAAIISLTVVPAFASSVVVDGEKRLIFNTLDDIAGDRVCLLVFGDMTQEGADSEGRAIIGGDLEVISGWAPSNADKFFNDYALIVGGNITGDGLVAGGCVAQNAGMSTISVTAENCDQGNHHIHQVTTGWIDAYLEAAEIQFKAASEQYAAKEADGTVTSTNWGDLVPSPNHVAGTPHVFEVDGSTGGTLTFNLNQDLSAYGSDSIIVNVSGKNLTFGYANRNIGNKAEFCSRVIWNCYEAETITIPGGTIQGSLLAPYAVVRAQQGHINGTTIVQEMHGEGGFEYHTGQFFKDPFSATLTVTKVVNGNANDTDSFGFGLYQQNGDSWTLLERFELKNGETKSFKSLLEGNTFRVVEEDTGKGYDLVNITGGDSSSVADRSATFTVTSVNHKIVFTNEQNTGSLTVSKTLEDVLDPSAAFAFVVERNEGGNWVVAGDCTLANGESKTFTDLPFGEYRVTETVSGATYDTTVNGTAGTVGTAVISADNTDPQVSFVNTRKTAQINVYKELAEGDTDTGESFTFTIKGEGLDEEFTLKAGDRKSFTGLVGASYTVAETNSGKSYVLASDPTGGKAVNLQQALDLVFVNTQVREGITVRKTVTGEGGNADDLFTFTIVGDGINETFQLRAGESKTFTGLPVSSQYTITEVDVPANYEFVSVTGGSVNGQSTVIAPSSGAAVEFVNAVKTGSITLTKTYSDIVEPGKKFSFAITDAAGNSIKTVSLANGESETISGLPYGATYTVTEQISGNTFTTTADVDGTAVAGTAAQVTIGGDHNVNFTNTRNTARLSIYKQLAEGDVYTGEQFEFNISGPGIDEDFTLVYDVNGAKNVKYFDALIGGSYTVTETNSGASYTLQSVTADGSIIPNGATIDVVGDMNLVFTNTLKQGSIYVTKLLSDDVTTDAMFTFTLQRNEGGAWKNVEPNGQVALGNGDSYEFAGLEYGYDYRVVESVDGDIYTTAYEIYDVEVSGGNYKINASVAQGSGATSSAVTLTDDIKNIVFTNSRKTAQLTVNKALVSGDADLGESFRFQLYRQNGNSWAKVGSEFTLKAGDSKTFTGLAVATQYRVVETVTGASYVYDSIAGAAEQDGTQGGVLTLTGDADVTVYNRLKSGSITVTKTLSDPSELKEDSERKFQFTVQTKKNGQWTELESFALANGESKKISGIAYGTECRVIEAADDRYTVSYKVASDAAEGNQTDAFVVNGDEKVAFTNTRNTAKLTVYKELAEGDIDTGESFSFTIKGAALDEKFTLKAGDSKSFDGLVGASYTVTETDSGKTYMLSTDPTGGKAVNLQKALDLVFVNTKLREGITVKKTVTGEGGKASDTFTFTIVGTGLNETFELKAGESKTFDDLPLGEQYTITETAMGSVYEFVSVTGGKANGQSTVIEAAEGAVVEFTNAVKTGSITIGKSFEDIIEADKKFVFNVTDASGKIVKTVELGDGETATISDLPYGNTYTVSEVVDGKVFATAVSTDGAAAVAATSAKVTIGGEHAVNFTNTRKTEKLSVYKQLKAGDVYTGEVFSFEIKGPGLDEQFDLVIDPNGEKNVVTFDALVGGSYTVTETDSGDSYTLYSDPTGGKPVNIAEEMSLVFVNAINMTTVRVHKQLNDTIAPDAQFAVTATITDAEGNVTTKTGTVSAKKDFIIEGVPYGSTVAVSETVDGTVYETKYYIDDAFSTEGNSVVTNAPTADLYIVNTRRQASATITKFIADGDKVNADEQFGFQLYEYTNGSYKAVADGAFTLKADESKTINGLLVGGKYRVVETSTGASYSFKAVSAGQASSITDANGIVCFGSDFTLPTEGIAIDFTNQIRRSGLTVRKIVAGGSIVAADTFHFEIYKNGADAPLYVAVDAEGNATVSETGTGATGFDLAASEAVVFGGLELTDSYTVVETTMGDRYEFGSVVGGTVAADNAQSSTVTITDQPAELVFTNNVRKGSLTVEKTVIDEIDADAEFLFTVQKKNGGAWTDIDSFTLAGGQSATVDNISYGDVVRVVETVDGVVYSTAYSVDGAESVAAAATSELTINKESTVAAFTNERNTAALNITKTASGAMEADEEFAITVNGIFDGANGAATKTYYFTADGTNTDETKAENTYKIGAPVAVEGVLYGGVYTITENGAEQYDTVVTVNGKANAGKTAELKAVANNEAVIANTRQVGALSVTKTLDKASHDMGETFTFKLYREIGGEWVQLGDDFTLNADDTEVFEDLELGFKYKVVETDTGASYSFDSISENADLVSDEEGFGASFVLEDDMDINFTNCIKRDGITVFKTVSGEGGDEDESFKFSIEVKDGKKWKEVETFELKAGESFTAEDLAYGMEYRITETDSGKAYVFGSVDIKTEGENDKVDEDEQAAYVTLDGAEEVVFNNPVKEAVLSVGKKVDRSADADDTFAFSLLKKFGSTWRTVETFDLKAGETKEFDVSYGVQYKVVELGTGGNYELANITGGDTNDVDDSCAYITIDEDEEAVEFTNELLTGELTVTKTVAGTDNTTGDFSFKLTDANGKAIKAGGASNGQFRLGHGGSITLTDIPYGTRVVVTETADANNYSTSYVIDGIGHAGTATSPITINSPSESVAYTNSFIGTVVLGAYDQEEPTVIDTPAPPTRVLGDSSPNTGDNVPVAVVIAIFVCSLVVLTFSKSRSRAHA